MNRPYTVPIVALFAAISCCAQVGAQVAGRTTVDIAVAKLEVVAAGWSAKRQILGRRSTTSKASRSARSKT